MAPCVLERREFVFSLVNASRDALGGDGSCGGLVGTGSFMGVCKTLCVNDIM